MKKRVHPAQQSVRTLTDQTPIIYPLTRENLTRRYEENASIPLTAQQIAVMRLLSIHSDGRSWGTNTWINESLSSFNPSEEPSVSTSIGTGTETLESIESYANRSSRSSIRSVSTKSSKDNKSKK